YGRSAGRSAARRSARERRSAGRDGAAAPRPGGDPPGPAQGRDRPSRLREARAWGLGLEAWALRERGRSWRAAPAHASRSGRRALSSRAMATGENDPRENPRRAGGEGMPGGTATGKVSFGQREVEAGEKPALVRDVFRSVAGRYDVMNDLMSLGIHRLWKDRMVDRLRPLAGETILDVAGGTGDVAFRILDRTAGGASVTALDLTPEMLLVGRDRAIDSGRLGALHWVCGDAEALPLPDRCFDAYTVAFGLRNVTHLDRALAEARRVLK